MAQARFSVVQHVSFLNHQEMLMFSKIVVPMLLLACLSGCAAHQDSYSKSLGLPDTTESKKE
jgi:hypothetical protein